jgi:hypothetical protein
MTPTEAIYRLVSNIQTIGGFAAAIAIMITATLCLVYLFNPGQREELGRALVYVLTIIIGFYFGTHAPEKMKDPISAITSSASAPPSTPAPAPATAPSAEQPKSP